MISFLDKFTIPTVYGICLVNGSRKELANLTRFTIFPPGRFSPAALAESGRFLSQMREITEDRAACDRVKSEYEGCIYRVKDCLEFDTNFRLVITDEEHAKIAEEIDAHQAWFEGAEPAQASLSTFQDSLDALKNMSARAEFRASEVVKRPAAFAKMNQTLTTVRRDIYEVWPKTMPWLKESVYVGAPLGYTDTLKFYREKMDAQNALPLTEDLFLTVEEIGRERQTLELLASMILRIKKLTPTATPSSPPTQSPTTSKAEAQTQAPTATPADESQPEAKLTLRPLRALWTPPASRTIISKYSYMTAKCEMTIATMKVKGSPKRAT
jgi:hypothetical protein